MINDIITSDGTFYVRKDTNTIYVQGSINGKTYKRSIKKAATALNLKRIKKLDPIEELLRILKISRVSKTEVSFSDFGYRFLRATGGNRDKETQEDYERIFRISIQPYFKDYTFSDFTTLSLIEFYNSIRDNYCYYRSKRTKNILNNILETAFDEEIMEKNLVITKLIRDHKFTPDESNTTAYNISEVKTMLNESKGWMKIFIEISLKYGLRVCETTGLKWSDFDLERGLFQVNRYITKGKIKEKVKPKSNKKHFREIFLFPETITLLKKYENFKPDEEWLFVNKEGKPFLQSRSIATYHFKPALEKMGVEYKAFHAMRRSYISIMRQSEKIDKNELQEIVGHSKDSKVTDKHYNLDCLNDTHKQKKAQAQGEVYNSLLELA